MLKWEGPGQTEDLVTLVTTNSSISVAYSHKGLFLPLAGLHPGPGLKEEPLFRKLLVSPQRNTRSKVAAVPSTHIHQLRQVTGPGLTPRRSADSPHREEQLIVRTLIRLHAPFLFWAAGAGRRESRERLLICDLLSWIWSYSCRPGVPNP